uniref:Uncharacterized protein n=1 Tax=Micrurus corallinus TaxID=54390 RepID=A0A2D4F390_MICCO
MSHEDPKKVPPTFGPFVRRPSTAEAESFRLQGFANQLILVSLEKVFQQHLRSIFKFFLDLRLGIHVQINWIDPIVQDFVITRDVGASWNPWLHMTWRSCNGGAVKPAAYRQAAFLFGNNFRYLVEGDW